MKGTKVSLTKAREGSSTAIGVMGDGENRGRAYLLFRPAALRLAHHLPLLCLDARRVAGALHLLVVA